MNQPPFIRPDTLAEALAALAMPGIGIVAGGTDYFPALGDRVSTGPVLDLSGIRELAGIVIGPDDIRIGGATRWTQVIRT